MAQVLATPVALSLSLICNTITPNPISLSNSLSFPTSTKFRSLSIKSVRVGGVEIPNNKRVEFSLQYIHGIGRTRARQILCDRRRPQEVQCSGYKEIQCYRGIRHIQGLPCRGQRTKNNCRTLKGKRVAIAGKKKAPR